MRIDEINPAALREAPDAEVLSLHLRLHQLFAANFAGNDKLSAGTLETNGRGAEPLRRETLVNAELFAQDEFARRGFKHEVDGELTEEAAALRRAAKVEHYALVHPSGEAMHRFDSATLEEVLACYCDPIALRMPCVYLVGSTANEGRSENDIDLLVRGPLDEDTRRAVEFRLGRALSPRLSERVQFHGDEHGGPFTCHVPLYDLVLVPHEPQEVIAMAAAKADDPMQEWPSKPGALRSVMQLHFRGKSVHLDWRIKVADYLVGWTVALQRPGAVPDVDDVAEARRIGRAFDPEGSRYTKPFVAPAKLRAFAKLRQPLAWLDVDGVKIEPGEVGATAEEEGVLVVVDKPRVEFGLQKPFSHEYFVSGERVQGIIYLRQLVGGEGGRTEGGEPFWTFWLSKTLLPGVLDHRAVETRSMPPDGHHALPSSLAREVPESLRYWEHSGEKARAVRDALVKEGLFAEDRLRMVDGEVRLVAPARKAAGRPATLAARVAALLPRGRSYAHPFLASDWRTAVEARAGDADALLVLSPPIQTDVAEIADAVAGIARADWLVECDDTPAARTALARVGRPFALPGERRLFCASFPVRAEVVWLDSSDEALGKGPRTARFVLLHQEWKGQTVVRAAPSRQVWHLLVEGERGGLFGWELARDPLAGDAAISAVRRDRPSAALLNFEGEVEPGGRVGGEVLNDTKNTPSAIHRQDAGVVVVRVEEPALVVLDLRGKDLRGRHHVVAEEAGSRQWQFGPGAEPERAVPEAKAHREITLELADGMRLDGVQVWDPKDRSLRDDKGGDREKLRPLALFKPMKVPPRAGNELREIDAAAAWPSAEMLALGVVVEPKWNGFRFVVEKDADGRVLMFSEEVLDQKGKPIDYAANLPRVAAEARELPGPYVLDCEFMAEHAGVVVPRRELAAFRGAKPVDDSGVRLRVFRALYLPEVGNLTAQHETENAEALRKFLGGRKREHFIATPRKLVLTRPELRSAIRWAARQPGSEGAMLKSAVATYSLGGENDSWSKLKLVREVRALVYGRDPVEGSPGVWTLLCAVGPVPASERTDWSELVKHGGALWAPVGKTFNTSLDAKSGDAVLVEVTELLVNHRASQRSVAWFTPTVIDRADAPMTVEQVEALAQPGEVRKVWDRDIRIAKAEPQAGEERYVLGIVLEPNDGDDGAPLDPDAQRDVYSAEEVRQAAHAFMSEHGHLGLMHEHFITGAAKILESYVAPTAFEVGGVAVRKGTWLLAIRVVDDALWAAVKSGDLAGFSIGGSASRKPVDTSA